MKKAGVLSILILAVLLALAVVSEAQQPKKVPHIGFLSGGSDSIARPNIDAFLQGLNDLGYVEENNIRITYRFAEGRVDRLAELVTDLVRLKVDVLLAGGTPPALAAKQATQTIPVVFVTVADPLRVGLVASFAHPGGNMTGMTTINSELTLKRLELLKETVPTVSQVAFLRNPSDASNVLGSLKELQDAARGLGLAIRPIDVRYASEFDAAFSTMTRERVHALIVLAGTLGSWIGASVMYWASRLAGRPLLMRFGKYVFISAEKIEGAETRQHVALQAQPERNHRHNHGHPDNDPHRSQRRAQTGFAQVPQCQAENIVEGHIDSCSLADRRRLW